LCILGVKSSTSRHDNTISLDIFFTVPQRLLYEEP
jgi:hypothetical protein